jgi:transposase InsO family protein
MRDLALLTLHLVGTLIRLARPGGLRAVVAESMALRQQVLVLSRGRHRAPRVGTLDRVLAAALVGLIPRRRLPRVAIAIRPATLLGWHRALVRRKYRRLFGQTSRRRPGPRGPDPELVAAIVATKARNPQWGCARIAQQLALAFGIDLDKDVVRRVLARHRRPGPSGGGPSWLTFLGNARDSLWSVDLFRCESATLRSHWVMVVLDQWSRRIVGLAAAPGPLDGPAICRLFNRATRGAGAPAQLSTDHDPLFTFHRWRANLRVLGIDEVKTLPYVPLSHPFVERLIGTLRREYLDQLLFWGTADLQRKLDRFADYYNEHRCHAGIGGIPPADRDGRGGRTPLPLREFGWRSHCRGLFQTPAPA